MKQKIALVLSGGGARGIAHIGVIEELLEHGFEISSIAGTSMGALVGGVYAVDKMKEYRDWVFTLDKYKVFSLVDFTLSKSGFIKGEKVLNRMKEFISDTLIEDLPIPYAAVSVDIINHEEVVFTTGSIFDAIRASISIPTIFTPVKTDRGLLVDGGVMNNIPVNHVKRIDGDILVVVNVNAFIPADKPKKTKEENQKNSSVYQKKLKEFYSHLHLNNQKSKEEHLGRFNLLTRTISLMTYKMAQLALEKHSPDILIEVSGESCNTYDFYKAKEIVEIGRHATNKALEKSFIRKS